MDREFLASSLPSAPPLILPGAGDQFDFGAYATHWKIDGSQTGGRFAVVHHPLMPHTLGHLCIATTARTSIPTC